MTNPPAPRIFVSHAHADKDLVDKLLDTLVVGLGLDRASFTISSLPGLGVPVGQQFIDHLRSNLSTCDGVVLVLTPNFYKSIFSICEMGAAWALGKTVWPLVVPPLSSADVRDVLTGVQILALDTDNALDTMADELAQLAGLRVNTSNWVAKREQFNVFLRGWLQDAHQSASIVLERGNVLDSMIDCVMYLPAGAPQQIKAKILESVRERTVLPTTYAYLGESGLEHWLDLTRDPGYETYQESQHFFNDRAEDVAAAILDAVGGRSIDFVSLGPGNGQKDHDLVDALVAKQGKGDDPHYYYPFDINPDMIAVAVQRLRTNERIARSIRIKAIVADFGKLQLFRPVFEYRRHPNVLALLGNTIGNMPDDRAFLEKSYEAFTSPRDLLLLEVNTVGQRADIGDVKRNKRFDFGPLEILGVKYEAAKLTYKRRTGASSIPNTETTVAIYEQLTLDRQSYRDVRLSYIHEYDLQSLEDVLTTIGFQIITRYRQRLSTVLLLRRGTGALRSQAPASKA
jgi:hypothetical protein